jgi:hypothetical protein
MGYLQVLNLMVKAYKAARGVMPKGLDLLKLKMKARQKVIDSKKVIEFPKERITDPFKARPPKELARLEGGGEGIKRLLEKGLIKIGEVTKRKKVKEPVDPKLVQQESIKDMYKRLMKSNREAIKNFKNRNKPRDDKANGGPIDPSYLGIPPVGLGTGSRPGGHPYPSLDYYDDDAGVKGLMKKRKKKKKKREKKATGGLANLSQTYDNNPTLQSQFPDKQDYLDLFSSTTTTTPQTTTYTQMTEQQPAAGIPAIKPIVPIIPQGDGDSGVTGILPRAPKEPLTFRESMAKLNLQRGVPVEEEEISFFDKIKQFSPTYQFMKAGKKLKDAGQQAIDDYFAKKQKEKELAAKLIAQQNIQQGSSGGPGEGAGTFGASINEATGARGSGTGFSDYT